MSTQDPDSSWAPSANDETIVYLPNIAANVSATTCLNVPQALDYIVYAYIVCTATGGGDSVPTFTISFTDDSGANTLTLAAPNAPTSGHNATNVISLYCTAGSSITYTIASGVFTGGSTYSLRMIIKIV